MRVFVFVDKKPIQNEHSCRQQKFSHFEPFEEAYSIKMEQKQK